MKILGTGLSGLVGSRVTKLLEQKYNFVNFSLENGNDITNRDEIIQKITVHTDSKWMLHFAAFTNVQQAELEKELGVKSSAWQVNVNATKNIVDAARAIGMKVIYLDTDYAFDGTKLSYDEQEPPNPQSFYAKTKSEGAKLVISNGGIVVRIANPYRAYPVGKTDFVHKMIELLQSGKELLAPTNQLFVPTFIDDLAYALDALIDANAHGIYHVVSSRPISPYDAAKFIAKTYNLQTDTLKAITFADYFNNRAPAPQYAVLKADKIQQLGVVLHSFEEGLVEVKKQELQDPRA